LNSFEVSAMKCTPPCDDVRIALGSLAGELKQSPTTSAAMEDLGVM
jgi:hypothetical protein